MRPDQPPLSAGSLAPDRIARLPLRPGELAVVVGAGVSGEAAARLLAAAGVRARLLERKAENIPARFLEYARAGGVEILAGEHSPEQFAGASLVVASPGVPLSVLVPLLKAVPPPAPPLMGEMELALALADEPVLAVTGSSGKTTTASLAAAMLREAGRSVFLGGNIGIPLSSHVLEGRRADVLVLEVSSFQLQGCKSLRPKVGILLNLTPNHLDRHAGMAEYAEAKFSLFARQTREDVAVLPPELEEDFCRRGLAARREIFADRGRFPRTRLLGRHNAANAEAAYLAARVFGVDEEAAARAVAGFTPLRHRLEPAGSLGGVLYVNDSKCTTVDSLRAALSAFEAPILLLAGGRFKGGDLAGLGELLRRRVKAVVLFGACREVFETAWTGIVPLSWHESLAPAFAEARQRAAGGDVVLLSPAAASYDLYANYEQRGDHFCRLVRELS
ncbi:MAG: UDP-N-acetylmuramoyl-L-alanine--D-glutamate ligase [Desulfovibrio sp.]|jgi:UDP-N-acetylmuramoylalanine--D-glutamate ligase|nr:UDP-N-acetylmuramoyl-L-alanine--D-glutamate ligase [Desulfovibrio sp.]